MPTMFAAAGVDELIKTGGSCRVDANVKPRFALGDKIVARNINPASHTRLPQYVRGKRGLSSVIMVCLSSLTPMRC